MKIEVIEEYEGFQISVESKSVLGRGNASYTLRAKEGDNEVFKEELGWCSGREVEDGFETFKKRCLHARHEIDALNARADEAEEETETPPEEGPDGGTPPPTIEDNNFL